MENTLENTPVRRCSNCPEPVAPGKSRCEKHRKAHAATERARVLARKAKGLPARTPKKTSLLAGNTSRKVYRKKQVAPSPASSTLGYVLAQLVVEHGGDQVRANLDEIERRIAALFK